MSGRVTLRISLQPSWPSKSSRRGVLACSIVPIAPSATTTRSARASRRPRLSSTRLRWKTSRASLRATRRRTLTATGRGTAQSPHDGEVAPGDRARRLSRAGRPVADRGLRGVERRGRRGHRGGRAPRGRLGRRAAHRGGPRGLLRLPGQPADGLDGRRGAAAGHLADDPGVLRPAARRRPRRRAGPRHRAEHALEAVHRRDPRRLPRAGRRDGGDPRRAAGRLARTPARCR